MSVDRRGFLGSIATILSSPKLLFNQRAAGFPAARLIDGYYREISPMKIGRSVICNLPFSEVFLKNNVEHHRNSEDTSIVFSEFGVSIYSDPSGIYVNEK